MTFEYKTLTLPSSAERQIMLSEMGLNGWELVAFEQGLAYFKRPIDEPDEVIGSIADQSSPESCDIVSYSNQPNKYKVASAIVAKVKSADTIGSKKK